MENNTTTRSRKAIAAGGCYEGAELLYINRALPVKLLSDFYDLASELIISFNQVCNFFAAIHNSGVVPPSQGLANLW